MRLLFKTIRASILIFYWETYKTKFVLCQLQFWVDCVPKVDERQVKLGSLNIYQNLSLIWVSKSILHKYKFLRYYRDQYFNKIACLPDNHNWPLASGAMDICPVDVLTKTSYKSVLKISTIMGFSYKLFYVYVILVFLWSWTWNYAYFFPEKKRRVLSIEICMNLQQFFWKYKWFLSFW